MADDAELEIDLNRRIERESADVAEAFVRSMGGIRDSVAAERLRNSITRATRHAVAREIMAWLESGVYRSHGAVGAWELGDRLALLTDTAPDDWHQHPGASLRRLYADGGVSVDGQWVPFRAMATETVRAEMLGQLHAGLGTTAAQPSTPGPSARPWITVSALRKLGVSTDLGHLREFFGAVDVEVVDR
jgi:hypothetical protein